MMCRPMPGIKGSDGAGVGESHVRFDHDNKRCVKHAQTQYIRFSERAAPTLNLKLSAAETI